MEEKSDEELVERYKEITDQLEKGDTEDLETQKTDIKQEYEEKVEKLKQQYEKQMKEIKQEYEEKKEEVKEECERQLSDVMEREADFDSLFEEASTIQSELEKRTEMKQRELEERRKRINRSRSRSRGGHQRDNMEMETTEATDVQEESADRQSEVNL